MKIHPIANLTPKANLTGARDREKLQSINRRNIRPIKNPVRDKSLGSIGTGLGKMEPINLKCQKFYVYEEERNVVACAWRQPVI